MSKVSRRLRGLISRPQDDASTETQQSSSPFQDISSSNNEDQDDELDINAFWIRCLDGSRRKMRERATASDVYNLPMGDKILVEIDDRNCPCTKASYLLGTFLSSIAKDGNWTPIHIPRWDNEAFVKKKQDLLDYIELKFSYDEKARSWVLAKYFGGKSFNMAESNPPDDPNVLPEQWGPLVILWNNPDKKMDENGGREPDRITLWDETHKRKDGSYAKEETKIRWLRHIIYFLHVLVVMKKYQKNL